ncbi:hypothetical protein J010_00506 [Cryptococcus neoformans]|nr:hypothetical protein AYX15_00721 [Cryptococcus neoformans var. grubii]OWZ80698.1 hypothetical protein C365_00521 [Cryptococcus neoformans var. grubii Bt85]OXG54130.1 hypothetical protein C355_00526 [Cryptococcus neoformans var. grubii Th84]OXM81555.1 hypothetical protein C364_00524 [Cryptococcus neoformans var. grubii Bt63]OWZ73098.1 hypothetical protein AYX14_01351 [Cryptococcus neoformans var. grubii]
MPVSHRRSSPACNPVFSFTPRPALNLPHVYIVTYKMGFQQSAVLGSCAFLLGMVFVSQVVDIPLLYQPVTPEAIDNAYKFYEMWWEAPGAVKALFHVALGLPLVVLLIKLHKWSESAVFFDGSCIVMHLATVVLYLTVHINSFRTFLYESTVASSYTILPPQAPRDVPPTADERIEAVRVLAAGNALVGLLTLGVMGMQIGQEYAKRVEEREEREVERKVKKDI